MNLLVVGVSHHTAPVELLERLTVARDELPELLRRLVSLSYVGEAVVLSTCNRVEVYAAVSGFHGGLAEIGAVLAERASTPIADLTPNLYVHFDADAVRHALRVAGGLDSMVVGESQVLGQLREAYRTAAEHDCTGRLLHELMRLALRVGKRVHTETGIDAAGRSIVSAGLDLVPGGVRGRSALVVGAGSMGALALATLQRAGAAPLLVASRSAQPAQRLARTYGATVAELGDLARHLGEVEIAVFATASVGPVLTLPLAQAATANRTTPLSIVDLAVPRDVVPEVGLLPGVTLIDLPAIAEANQDAPSAADKEASEAIVASEVQAFQSWRRGAEIAPAVAALRERADAIVAAELRRLWQRRPDLDEGQRAELVHTLHRIVQRLLHQPTVQLRELAASPEGDEKLAVLRELLGLPESPEDLDRAVGVSMRDAETDDWEVS